MSNNKFEDAILIYPTGEKKSILVTEITKIRRKSDEEYQRNYKPYMFCSECKRAQLSHYMTNKTIPYLKTIPTSEHLENCSFNKKCVEKKEFERYANSKINDTDIKNRLNKILDMFFEKQPISKDNPFIFRFPTKNRTKPDKNKDNNIGCVEVEKFLPRKLLNNTLTENDYDTYKFFYGKVRIHWKKVENGKLSYHLFLFDINEKNSDIPLCNIAISKSVSEYIPSEYKNDMNCKIAFLSKLQKSSDGKYTNALLINSTHLLIRKL